MEESAAEPSIAGDANAGARKEALFTARAFPGSPLAEGQLGEGHSAQAVHLVEGYTGGVERTHQVHPSPVVGALEDTVSHWAQLAKLKERKFQASSSMIT